MVQKISAILLLVFLFVVMPVIGMMTNSDYVGFFIAQVMPSRVRVIEFTPQVAPIPLPSTLVSAAMR